MHQPVELQVTSISGFRVDEDGCFAVLLEETNTLEHLALTPFRRSYNRSLTRTGSSLQIIPSLPFRQIFFDLLSFSR